MEQGRLKAKSREHSAESSPDNYASPIYTLKAPQLSGEVEFLGAKGIYTKSPVAELSHIVARRPVEALGDLGANVQSPWLVVKTKTKCEKFVRDKLLTMGMEAFVPLKRRTAVYNRKVKVYDLPLITCYTFVRLDKSRRNQVLALPYVQGILRMNGKDCLVSDQEMHWLHKVSGIEQEVTTETLSMQQGDQVMIAYGQLAGMEGKIVSRRSKHEVVVALESLGLQMVLQVDPAMLVPFTP
jgi:transcription antitermination factor NusG